MFVLGLPIRCMQHDQDGRSGYNAPRSITNHERSSATFMQVLHSEGLLALAVYAFRNAGPRTSRNVLAARPAFARKEASILSYHNPLRPALNADQALEPRFPDCERIARYRKGEGARLAVKDQSGRLRTETAVAA